MMFHQFQEKRSSKSVSSSSTSESSNSSGSSSDESDYEIQEVGPGVPVPSLVSSVVLQVYQLKEWFPPDLASKPSSTDNNLTLVQSR